MRAPVLIGIIFLGLFYLAPIPKLRQAYRLWDEVETLYQTGDCYKATGEYPKAEEQYKLATNMALHKFYPLRLPAKLYNETGQNEKAVAIVRDMINKAVKVPSKAIEEIREEMQEIITSNIEQKTAIPQNKAKGESCTGGLTLIKQQFW